jgi:hypothetical protein
MYGFWLPLWYLQYFLVNHSLSFSYFPIFSILLCILIFTASSYPFGIFWTLYCMFFFELLLLITPLVSFGHCIVCPSLIYRFWSPIWYHLSLVLSVLCFSAFCYPFGIFWPLYCMFFFALRLLIISLVSFDHCVVCPSLPYGFWLSLWYLLAIVLYVLLCFTASDYLIGIFWSLYCMFFFALRLLIISLVSFDHCIVCSSLPYGFWLSLWYLLAIVLSVLLWNRAPGYPFVILLSPLFIITMPNVTAGGIPPPEVIATW